MSEPFHVSPAVPLGLQLPWVLSGTSMSLQPHEVSRIHATNLTSLYFAKGEAAVALAIVDCLGNAGRKGGIVEE